MRSGIKLALALAVPLVMAACSKPDTTDQNVAIDINSADPSDIEAVPADETSATPPGELGNGVDNSDVADFNDSRNAD